MRKEDFDFSDIDNRFVNENIGLIKYALKDFYWVKDWEDVFQEACIWLLMAKKKFDNRKSAWVTYASKFILWQYHIYRGRDKAQYRSPEKAGFTVSSLDKISETRDIGYKDTFEDDLEIKMFNESIIDMIPEKRTKEIIRLALLGYNQPQIAKKFGISHQRIQQIYKTELDKLKKEIDSMKKMLVYISGPMRGKLDLNKAAFEQAENYIISLGHTPVNPHNLTKDLINPSVEECLKVDIKNLLSCDAIHMLDGWKGSKGAKLEYDIAKAIGLKVI
jgi:RNA polymerase sigma factor (sigma-70 family)